MTLTGSTGREGVGQSANDMRRVSTASLAGGWSCRIGVGDPGFETTLTRVCVLLFPIKMTGPRTVSGTKDAREGTDDWEMVGSVEQDVGDSGLSWITVASRSGGVSRTKPSGMRGAFLALRVK